MPWVIVEGPSMLAEYVVALSIQACLAGLAYEFGRLGSTA